MANQDHIDEQAFVKKARKGPRMDDNDQPLNINSMMDIMTILLVFLLVSITSDPWNIKQDEFLQLAKSSVDRDPKDSIPILISKSNILVDNEQVIPVECTTRDGRQCKEKADFKKEGNRYSIDKTYKEDSSESSFLIEPLVRKLTEKIETAKELHASLKPGEPFKALTTIICDKDIPYRMIAEIVHTAGSAGLDQLRFAVIRNDTR